MFIEKDGPTRPATMVTKTTEISPELLRKHVWFDPVRNPLTGRRGYDEAEVDELLDLVANRIELLENEVERLQVNLEQLRERLAEALAHGEVSE